MLYLVHRNRFFKNINNPALQAHWRTAYKGSEDSLTSCVFPLLFYLPVEMLWEILYNACYHPCFPAYAGKILEKDIWPHWDCTRTGNIKFVEPDVFIRFENFDVIIEAKRYDDTDQLDRHQWENQVIAYYNEYGPDTTKRSLYYIALSGFIPGAEKQHPIIIDTINVTVEVTTCRWKRILRQVLIMLKKWKSLDDSIIFILQDLVLAFRVHGFLAGELLNSMPVNIKLNDQSFVNISKIKIITRFKPFPENLKNINNNNLNKLYESPLKTRFG